MTQPAIAAILSALARPEPTPAGVEEAIEALKRWLFDFRYQGPAGPKPTNPEAEALADALIRWTGQELPLFPTSALRKIPLLTSTGSAVSGCYSARPTGAWEQDSIRWEIDSSLNDLHGNLKRLAVKDVLQVELETMQASENWGQLERGVRQLLMFMWGRPATSIDEVCARVWAGSEGVSSQAVRTRTSKVNEFLRQMGCCRVLEKVRGEEILRWVE